MYTEDFFEKIALERTVVKPEQLIGTKWVGMCDLFEGKISVEFVDKSNCIYTSMTSKYPMTYSVTGGEVFIGSIKGPFELRGNILFNNDLPAFEKAA